MANMNHVWPERGCPAQAIASVVACKLRVSWSHWGLNERPSALSVQILVKLSQSGSSSQALSHTGNCSTCQAASCVPLSSVKDAMDTIPLYTWAPFLEDVVTLQRHLGLQMIDSLITIEGTMPKVVDGIIHQHTLPR